MRTQKYQSRFIEMFGTLDSPKVPVKRMIEVSKASGQYGLNASAVNYIEGKPRYIRITDICDDGSLNDDIKCSDIDDSTYSVNKGDVLFARTGATVGKTYLHRSGDACFAGYLIRYSFTEAVDPEYILAYTHSDTYYDWVLKSQKVGAQPNISASQYDNMPILIPGRKEQEAFLCLYRQADKSKFNGFKSRFIEEFNNPEIPKVSMSELCTTFIDGDWIEAKDQSDSGYRLVQTGNVGVCEYVDKEEHARFVSEDTFKRLNCTEIHPGDILFSRLPDPIGRCCLIPRGFQKAITAVDCTITRLKDSCLPEYLMVYTTTNMYSEQIKTCVTGTTRQRISRGNLAKIQVPLPSTERQQSFVDLVHQADKSKYLS